MDFKLIDSKKIKDKKVIVRLDLNSPDADKMHYRFLATKETISFLMKNKAKTIIVLAHLGRPESDKHSMKINNFDYYNEKLSLKVFKSILSKLYKTKIFFLKYSVSDERFLKYFKAKKLPRIILLENIRFYKGEENNDLEFIKKIANVGDIFIDEGFSVSHRLVASNSAITKILPTYYGFNYINEIKNLDKIIEKSLGNLAVIIGGAKIKDKSELLFKFIKHSKCVLIGGGIANTFIKNMGFEIGKSYYDEGAMTNASKLIFDNIMLPMDFKVLDSKGNVKTRMSSDVEVGDKILDVGPLTIQQFIGKIKDNKYVFWNGPLGYIEDERFSTATKVILEFIKNDKQRKYILGGGETLDCITKYEPSIFKQSNVFVSTGGGAMLWYLSKKIKK